MYMLLDPDAAGETVVCAGDARRAVDTAADAGVDFDKAAGDLPRADRVEHILAVVDAVDAHDIVVGQVSALPFFQRFDDAAGDWIKP